MKSSLPLSFVSLWLVGSIQAATVIADRIVVTNSILNANDNTTVATHWAEIQVFQLSTGVNVAASSNGGVAAAATSGYGSEPADANDGDTNGDFNAGSVWHDNDPEQPGAADPDVFTITFSQPFSVDSFNIWGRNQNTDRDNDFLVEFFNGTQLVGSNPSVAVDNTTLNTGVTAITAVPEPTSLVLVTLSLGVLGLRRRRA